MRLPIWNGPEGEDLFEDNIYWHMPEEGYPHVYLAGKQLPNEGEEIAIESKNGQTKM